MRFSAVLVAFAALALAATVKVTWYYNGKPITYITTLNDYYVLKLCVKEIGGSHIAVLTLRGDSVNPPKYYQTTLKLSDKESCRTVLVYFKKMPKVGGVDVVVKPDAEGLYVDLDVAGVKLDHVGYLKIVKASEEQAGLYSCLKVSSNVTRTVPGDKIIFTIKNNCNVPITLQAKVDMANLPDQTLNQTTVEPGKEAKLIAKVPKFYGVQLAGFLGAGPTAYVRGTYISVGKAVVYYIPNYDFFLYYIKPNLKAQYFAEGKEIKKASAGQEVQGCVYVPNIVPVESVPTLNATLKVVEDLMFAPDKVVAKNTALINTLPFANCITFTVEKQWNTRGYKLVLEVKEDVSLFGGKVPLVTSATASPELGVK